MTTLQARLFWAIIGILIGAGAITIFSVGIPLVLLGIVLVLYAASKRLMRPDRLLLWIALFAMGLTGMIVLISYYVTSDRSSDYFSDGYWIGALLFGALSLGGIVGGAVTSMRRQT
jgi:hypothetical protein